MSVVRSRLADFHRGRGESPQGWPLKTSLLPPTSRAGFEQKRHVVRRERGMRPTKAPLSSAAGVSCRAIAGWCSRTTRIKARACCLHYLYSKIMSLVTHSFWIIVLQTNHLYFLCVNNFCETPCCSQGRTFSPGCLTLRARLHNRDVPLEPECGKASAPDAHVKAEYASSFHQMHNPYI